MNLFSDFNATLDAAIRRRDRGLSPFPNDNFELRVWGEELNPRPAVQPPQPRAKLKRDILALLVANPHGLTPERIWQLLRPGMSARRVLEVMWKMKTEGYPLLCVGWGFWTYRPEGHEGFAGESATH